MDDLIPVSFALSAANGTHIEIVGALLVRLEGVNREGQKLSCATMAYVSPEAEGFFLSLEAMVNLGLINRESPLFPGELRRESTTGVFSSQGAVVQHPNQEGMEACACPEKSLPPEPTVTLPFEAKPENNHLKQ